MALAEHIRRLREKVGHELLVLPSVAVIPRDDAGRVLLVQVSDTGQWAAIGGAIEPDESPEDAAVREALEEAGVTLRLGRILAVVGGPQYRITYPNGDETSYVSTIYDAQVIGGAPAPDGDETLAVAWWPPEALPCNDMSSFTQALISAIGLGSH